MSSNMMDTEKGGESTQYESIHTVTKPHSKQSGQLGGDVPGTTVDDKSGVDSDRAKQTTENIRYGQNISESGVGGMTTTSTGSANQEGGYGGTEAQQKLEDSDQNPRTSQQYSAKSGVHDHNVGA
ncbi:hypothetical protein LTR05_004133 [Lithohypha guttulata]|uniref:Uncharacterized protein n=1 Tax=Lithohypha guttulata TaxID=1690604 RepID=A0AAN7T101_9EURO|nr:hypothetical protein LTR05_004133 [Lithohypha guttulata]